MNLDISKRYPIDLCDDKIINTINKGNHFLNKYFNIFFPSSFNNNELKCYLNNTSRTIKSLIYRFFDFLPQEQDFKSMSQEQLKEFIIKNFSNEIFDDLMIKNYVSVV